MILVLDLDRTLNRLSPPWTRSIRDLVPPGLARRGSHEVWNWIAAHLAENDYPVHDAALQIVRALSVHASYVIVNTGRPALARDVTKEWLGYYFQVDKLLMRAEGDFRRTVEVKRDHLKAEITALRRHETIYAFDDNREAVQMYKEHGAIAFLAPDCWSRLTALAISQPNARELLQGLSRLPSK